MTTTHPTTCPLDCPDACGVLLETGSDGAFRRLRGNRDHTWSRGHLCGKTMLYGEIVASSERLRTPLVREGSKSGPLRAAGWDEALARIAARVRPLDPADVLALWYGGTMGLVQRKFPLRVMHALGATFHDGGVCDSSSTAGYEAVLGRCVGPDLERAEEADLVLLWGCDAVRTVQHLVPALKRLCDRGVPVVAVDVYRTDTVRALERWGGSGVVLRPGTDAQLALCLARIAYEVGRVDRERLARVAVGAPEFEDHVLARHDLEETAAITGVPVARIAELARLLCASSNALFKAGVGWTRRRNGAMGMRAVCSLAAALGYEDRVHYESFAHFGLAEDAVVRPDLRAERHRRPEVAQVSLGRTLSEGRFRAAFVWCHNPAVVLPDSRRVRAGLAREDLFLVVHDHFLTETAALADVVLPATTFVEHADVYRSYGHRTVQQARAAVAPPGEARSNVDCFAAIARALGLPRECVEVDAEGLCRELIEASRERFTDEELARLSRGEPVKLHELAREDRGTPSGRVELASADCARRGQPAIATYVPDHGGEGRVGRDPERGAFWLVAAPSVDTHNSTYSHSARHLAKAGPPRVHVHPEDALALGLVDGARARLSNARGALTLPVATTADVPRGLVRVDGLPRAADVPEGVGINALTSGDLSDLGDGNVMFSARVDLAPA